MILRRGERHEPLAVGQHEVRRFLADQELLEHDAIAGGAEAALDHQRAESPPRPAPDPRR